MLFIFKTIIRDDYAFLKDMLYEAIFVPEGLKPLDRSILDHPEISKYLDSWGRQGDFGLILSFGVEQIGAIWGRLFPENDKGYGFVDSSTPELSMAIKSDYRNQGMGTKLLSGFLKYASEKGYNKISLSVDKRNQAFSFYKKNGFVIFSESGNSCTMTIRL
jgi:ribosomal protein S18 acetylase RimI-like enzyme